ncbi:MAG: NUDIX hydrolase [Treponema sp.]|nr:NUDIX hydrolase [Treponema sp.]
MSKEKSGQNSDADLVWKSGNKERLLDTPVFTVNKSRNISPDGKAGDFITIDALDWAAVIPEVEGSFLMVKQWRHGSQSLSLEFPGGVIDAGESPEEGAARELLEETGCHAQTLVLLGSVSPNPALFTNQFHVFLARGLEAVGKQKLDDTEYLNCVRVPKEEVFAKMGGPECPHALMAAALELYRQKAGE